MALVTSVEVRSAQLDRLYVSALKRSNWEQIEAGETTPAEEIALKIASLQMRCSRQGPNPRLNPEREKIAVAASWFLFKKFEVGAHWEGLPETFAASVARSLLESDEPTSRIGVFSI